MVYRSETTKWKAYQFSDPFAAGSFFVCNKLNRFFCRPDCDARPRTNLKSEIKFVNSAQEATSFGFIPCESCDPMHSTAVDVGLLIKCVSTVNNKVGFMPPLLDENEELNSRKIKENILESKRANEEQILKTINGIGAAGAASVADVKAESGVHRASMPHLNYQGKASKDLETTSLSKNDSDHYRLVDLACRHLALAAAVNVFQPKPIVTPEEPVDPAGTLPTGSKKRRRRGGVLGFKELAAKSKLSAWHFHRVFKSVTGLTPKTYGDKCWEFIKKVKESGEYTTFEAFATMPPSPASLSSSSTCATSSKSSMPTSPVQKPKLKKVKMESTPTLFTTQSVADANKLASHSPNTPLTPPNQQYSSASLSQLSTVQSEMPDSFYPQSSALSFDDDETLQNLPSFDMGDESNNNSSSNNYYSDENGHNYLHMKAFSYPDLSKFRGDSLFNHSQPLQYSASVIKAEDAADNTQPSHLGFADFLSSQSQSQPQLQSSSSCQHHHPSSSTSSSTSTQSFNNFDGAGEAVSLNLSEEFVPNTSLNTSFDEGFFTTTSPFLFNNNATNYFGAGAAPSSTTNSINNNNTVTNPSNINDDIFNDTSFLAINPQLAASIGL
ncbi:uncharacterized protein LODBEIA_P46080 [Lodderomyces beijingensis]|uniref:Ada DNA repair metal-binding domain-containing protein n=1 Tax=Lodderomyces beijingensis TaxID=1775926 RepID=A0ABP0ZR42_9ASCO